MRLLKARRLTSDSESKKGERQLGQRGSAPLQDTANPTASLADYNAFSASWKRNPDQHRPPRRYWDGRLGQSEHNLFLPLRLRRLPMVQAESATPRDATTQDSTHRDHGNGQAADGTSGHRTKPRPMSMLGSVAPRRHPWTMRWPSAPQRRWLNAAQAASVAAEMANTMQMATHARQMADQETQGALVARHEASGDRGCRPGDADGDTVDTSCRSGRTELATPPTWRRALRKRLRNWPRPPRRSSPRPRSQPKRLPRPGPRRTNWKEIVLRGRFKPIRLKPKRSVANRDGDMEGDRRRTPESGRTEFRGTGAFQRRILSSWMSSGLVRIVLNPHGHLNRLTATRF